MSLLIAGKIETLSLHVTLCAALCAIAACGSDSPGAAAEHPQLDAGTAPHATAGAAASGGPSALAGASGGAAAGATAGSAGHAGAGGSGGAPASAAGAAGATGRKAAGGGDGAEAGSAADSGTTVAGAAGYLHTQGAKLLDSQGREVRLSGVSWFGMETPTYAPDGLWSRSLGSILDQIKSLGFNAIRLPFSSQLFDSGSMPMITGNQNPDLAGVSSLQLMDKIVQGAGQRGLKIILDRHRPDSGGQSDLWYTSQYSEQRWLDDWTMLATRYASDPTVFGADLHNEPRGMATWGDGSMSTDWQLAAQRAGDAIHKVNSNWLIIVEGIEKYGADSYWWGGNLEGAAAHLVTLAVANRVVYSAHDYPASLYAQSWFSAANYPDNLPGVWSQYWGYLAEQDIAPVFVGEFGTKLQTDSDKRWLHTLTTYIAKHKLSWSFWSLNPNSGDTGGILQDDWMSVNQDKMAELTPILAPLID
jgi:endoglucanase